MRSNVSLEVTYSSAEFSRLDQLSAYRIRSCIPIDLLPCAVRRQLPTNYRDRRFRQVEGCACSSRDHSPRGRPIRIGHPSLAIRVPLILLAPKSDHAHWPGKIPVFLAFRVLKNDVHGVGIPLVLIDEHYRPLPIGPEHRIRRDKRVARCILNVTRARKRAMLFITRLHPFLRNHLASEILGSRLLKLELFCRGEHAEGSWRCVVTTHGLPERNVMKVIDRV